MKAPAALPTPVIGGQPVAPSQTLEILGFVVDKHLSPSSTRSNCYMTSPVALQCSGCLCIVSVRTSSR